MNQYNTSEHKVLTKSTESASFFAAQMAIWNSGLSSSEKIVLQVILAHWSRENPEPFPGLELIQRMTGLGRSAVFKHIAALERQGALRVIKGNAQRVKGKLRKPVNRYDVTACFAGRLPAQPGEVVPAGTPPSDRGRHDASHPVTDITAVHETTQDSPRNGQSQSAQEHYNSPSDLSKEEDTKGDGIAQADSFTSEQEEERETAGQKYIRQFYIDAYSSVHGEAPAFVLADLKALTQLLKSIGQEKARRAISNAFTDSFWSTRTTIQQIRSNPAKYLALKREQPVHDHYQVDDKGSLKPATSSQPQGVAAEADPMTRADVGQVFEQWKKSFNQPEATLQQSDARVIAAAVDRYGQHDCQAVAYYLGRDGYTCEGPPGLYGDKFGELFKVALQIQKDEKAKRAAAALN